MGLEIINFGNIPKETVDMMLASGVLGAIIAVGVIVAVVLLIALYIYNAIAWSTIAKKLRYKKHWLAWIPFANISLVLELGGYHWAWVFLLFIPIFGWIALIIFIIVSMWRIFERRGYPGWFSLSVLIPHVGCILYLVSIGFVAFKDQRRMAKKPQIMIFDKGKKGTSMKVTTKKTTVKKATKKKPVTKKKKGTKKKK